MEECGEGQEAYRLRFDIRGSMLFNFINRKLQTSKKINNVYS